MTKKRLVRLSILGVLVVLLGVAGFFMWRGMGSDTRIALVNFPGYQSSGIMLSNKDSHIVYEQFDEEQIEEYKDHDFILAFGMGLKWKEEERKRIDQLLDEGLPIQVVMATTPENNICNIDTVHASQILKYFDNGNKKNFQSLGRYVRKYIDRKPWFTTDPDTVVTAASEVYFHIDEDVQFEKKSQFEAYLRDKGYWHEGGKKVMIIGGLNDPFGGNKQNVDSLISSLSDAGHNVYPVSSLMGRLEFMREVEPDLVIYFPHGRLMMGMAEQTVDYLKARNIPLITPLTILQSRKEWEADPMGLMGGFMSQTIGMPELDGAVYPYVLTTQEKNDDGFYLLKAMPDRLKTFTGLVTRYLSLKTKANKDKKLAIYFFKGPGSETLAAQGLETVPALYNLLKRLKSEGYNLTGLPTTLDEFRRQMMLHGQILKPYAEGAFSQFVRSGAPYSVEASELNKWIKEGLSDSLRAQLVEQYGEAPGAYMSYSRDGKDYLAIARLQYGNVALLPQPVAGLGDDEFAIAHGAHMPPPYPYVGAYLWARYAMGADAIMHFGTHGSLEFTPQKQVALSSNDWGDQLVGGMPHFYYYTIGNIGESMMAKRRSYAGLISYLTPPFSESQTRTVFTSLQSAIQKYYEINEPKAKQQQSLEVKRLAIGLGINRELRLDSIRTKPYTDTEIEKIDNFAEEVASEKITGQLYTTGEVFTPERIHSTVLAMAADPIAYSKLRLDQQRGKADGRYTKHRRLFSKDYLDPAKALVNRLLFSGAITMQAVTTYAGITAEDLERAEDIVNPRRKMSRMMMAAMGTAKEADGKPMPMPVVRGKKTSGGGHPSWIPKIGKRPEHTMTDAEKQAQRGAGQSMQNGKANKAKAGELLNKNLNEAKKEGSTGTKPMSMGGTSEITKEQREWAEAVVELSQAILNVQSYKSALEASPTLELDAVVNALAGGYIAPSSGGDAVANPKAVPTGRNLYSVNAEATPSVKAWSSGVQLTESMLRQYKEKHGKYPTKVSFTFWSSEFIESEGATIAQVMYMVGVEPVRDSFGRVSDIRLIPSKELGRPRIDVVVQTSGQFRDLAASRLALLHRAIEMASEAKDKEYDNYVASGTTATEKQLVEAGMSPKEARELSTSRIFGGINGMYGTGIQEMITAGDKWENTDQIAEVYLNNMGASYTGQKDWGRFSKHLFRAALANTDVVIQPRQSNTWGALSLDHVYEFMGGLNLTVRSVTGKDPEAYFADYRNRNNARIQDLKEAIGVESRATVLNPVFIKEMMAGGASSLSRITEVVTNTYGWEVSKPTAIDDELWRDLYDTYVEDKHQLGLQARFEEVHPVALQEVTAVMLETIRKGMWQATAEQTARLAQLHTELAQRHGVSASGMAGSNEKLQQFIAQKTTSESRAVYEKAVQTMRQSADQADVKDGVVMKKQERQLTGGGESMSLSGLYIGLGVLTLFIVLLVILRRRRKQEAK